jgi:hypothetical protein
MARILDVVVDAGHPASVARFWAAALDGYQVAPYDDAELVRLRGLGIDDPEDDPVVLVEPAPGGPAEPGSPRLWFQLVPEPRTGKNRVHVDLACPDADAEAARLEKLGARVLARRAKWITMADPEDNEFCLMRGEG